MNTLEFLDMISEFMEPCINVVTEDRDVRFGGTLFNYCGVVGKHSSDAVKKGVYLFADAFNNDARLILKATAVYQDENGTMILYYSFKREIKGIHLYSLTGGGFAIEAIIDGVKSGPKKLSKEDVMTLTDKTDRKKLAEKYLIADDG